MSIHVKNLYLHADGDHYCLLSDDAPMKCPVTGDWLSGVIYMGTDGAMRSTSRSRWEERFKPVAEYDGTDEAVIAMIRRANPGDMDFDFLRVFESWHESEMSITGHMLELAVAATMEKWVFAIEAESKLDEGFEITISTEDLQRVVQTYEIERVPIPHGFTFRIARS
jgi:hypothetical protein